MQKIAVWVLLFWGYFWLGCKTKSNKQDVTYVHIDSFKFVANPVLPSVTLSHQITGVSVYYNNEFLGVFSLPATIPVAAAGTCSLAFLPCVNEYGQNSQVAPYPFYRADTFSFTAKPGKIVTYEGTTSFYSNVNINVISNFETGLTNFYLAKGSVPMTLVTAASPGLGSMIFEGSGSGSVYLTNPGVDSSADSTVSCLIPPGVAFIEFNYKSDLPFYIGIQSNLAGLFSVPLYIAGIYPIGYWQKIYIKVSDYTAAYEGSTYNF